MRRALTAALIAPRVVPSVALRPPRALRAARRPLAAKTVWNFDEAREYARSFGFGSADEYRAAPRENASCTHASGSRPRLGSRGLYNSRT
mmetsp:Transcript_4911/g.15331  ORF Transcript_4911/g.15331 Transcript_4911/m.15331 type:complete len:90 (-) Transcript_4911:171-440(-)